MIETIELISKITIITITIVANFIWIKHILFLKKTGGFKNDR